VSPEATSRYGSLVTKVALEHLFLSVIIVDVKLQASFAFGLPAAKTALNLLFFVHHRMGLQVGCCNKAFATHFADKGVLRLLVRQQVLFQSGRQNEGFGAFGADKGSLAAVVAQVFLKSNLRGKFPGTMVALKRHGRPDNVMRELHVRLDVTLGVEATAAHVARKHRFVG